MEKATNAPAAASEHRLGKFFFKYRNQLLPVVLLGLAFGTPPSRFRGDVRLDFWLDLAGIALALVGQAIRVATIGLQYIVRGGKNKQVYAKSLVVGGVFAHCRNPLYLGNGLGLVGMLIVHNGVWMYAIGIPFILIAYGSIIAEEERYLRGRFGAEYEEYCRRVPRLAIRLAGLWKTLRSAHFQWKRVLRKEYGTTFACASVFLAMLAWERVRLEGLEASREQIAWLAATWVAIFAGYLTIRVLKKRHVLLDEIHLDETAVEASPAMKRA